MYDSTGQTEHQNEQKSSSFEKTESVLRRQVSDDLKNKLLEYKDPKKGTKVLSALMGIHEKTLKRLIECENRPGYQTVFKIYRVLYNTHNDSELLDLIPPTIKSFLVRTRPRGFNDSVRYNLNIETELLRDPVFCEIYCLAGASSITHEYISYHYGKYGENIIEKMLSQNVLVPVRKNEYVLGTNQASMTVETLSKIGPHLVERYFKPENSDEMGENYLSLQIQGLNKEAYNKWLEIDKEAFIKKCEIADDKKNWGDIKSFTFNSTDTLTEPRKETKH